MPTGEGKPPRLCLTHRPRKAGNLGSGDPNMINTEIGGDVIDLRDVTDRVNELEELRDGTSEGFDEDAAEELLALWNLLDDLRGNGGDHDWRGDWYPGSMIAESYFEDYARELASDIYGKEIDEAKWPFDCIDWEQAASALKIDYGTVEFDGQTYLYR